MEYHYPVTTGTRSTSSGSDIMQSLRNVEGERDTLKSQVAELQSNQTTLMATCRSLAQELETRDQQTEHKEMDRELSRLSITSTGSSGLSDQSAHLYVRCTDLEKALEEATETTNEMQKMDLEKSKTIEHLSQKLQSMELSKHSSNPAQHQEGLDRLITGYKTKVAAAEEKQANAEVELGRLRQQYQTFIDNMQRENEALTRDRDRIGALEAQLQVYAEDFKSERHDREAAQGRVSELEQEVSILRAQLDSFQESSMARLHRNRMAALANLQNEYQQRHRMQQSYDIAPYQQQFRARGTGPIECDSDEVGMPIGEDEDIIDSLSMARSTGRVVADGEESQDSDSMLQCPKCNKGYSAEDHAQFLDHIDNCCQAS